MTFDEARAKFPTLGFALYALEPDGEVTLEVHAPDDVFSFVAPTAQAALDRAFPPDPPNVFD